MEPVLGLDFDEAGTGAGFGDLRGDMQLANILFAKGGTPLQNLRKALEAGYATSPDTMTGGGTFRIESLESAITNLIYTEKSTVMANDLLEGKEKADNTVLQYSTLDDIGEAFTYPEGGAPAEEDDQYSRKYKLVKFIGAIGVVTNVLLETNNLVNAREEKIRVKNIAIKKKLDQIAYFGNATNVPTEFDGFLTEVSNNGTSDQIIDMRGKRMTLEAFNQGVNVIENVAGYTDNLRLYMSPTQYKNYMDELLQNKRYFVNGARSTEQEIQGLKTNRLVYNGGVAPIRRDMFLNNPDGLVTKWPRRNSANNAFITTGDKPPTAPTITSIVPTNNPASQLDSGVYDYAVVAKNQYGHLSVPTVTGGANVTITSNLNSAVLVITEGGSLPVKRQHAIKFIAERMAVQAIWTGVSVFETPYVGAGTTVSDVGQGIPETGYMFLIEWSKEVCMYKQLLDLTLFPLATSVDALRWMQRLYGTLMVRKPNRIVVYKNVGTLPNE